MTDFVKIFQKYQGFNLTGCNYNHLRFHLKNSNIQMKMNKIKQINKGEDTITPWEQDENQFEPSMRSSRRQLKSQKTFLKKRNYSQPIRNQQRQFLFKKNKIQKIPHAKKVQKMQQEKQALAKTLNITFNIIQDPHSTRCPQKLRKEYEGIVSQMTSRTPSRLTTFRLHGYPGETVRSQPKNVFERSTSGLQSTRTPIKRETVIRSYANFFHSTFQRSKSKEKVHSDRIAQMLKVIRNNLRKDGELAKKIKKAQRFQFRQHILNQRGRQSYQQ